MVCSKFYMRKAQISFILVVVVVILLLVGFWFYAFSVKSRQQTQRALEGQEGVFDVEGVRGFVTSCLHKQLTDALIAFGLVGGKNGFFSEFFVYTDKYRIPYYYITNDDLSPGRVLMPQKDVVEKQILARYIKDTLKKCTNHFEAVKGLMIEDGDVTADVQINVADVSAVVHYPVTISQGGKRTVLDSFSVKISSRLSTILNISQTIVDKTLAHEDIVYWDYLTDVTLLGFNITAHAERNHTILYRILDPQSKVYADPYMFQFAVKVRVK